MHVPPQIKAKSIRFRRWSRTGYAVFCSLACSVTIGCLAVSIADKTFQKAAGISAHSVCYFTADAESPEKEKLELEVALLQVQAPSLIHITVESAAACAQQSILSYFLIQTVERSLSLFQPFFILFSHEENFYLFQFRSFDYFTTAYCAAKN